SNVTGLNVWLTVVEYNASVPLRSAKTLALSSGNNAIYTASSCSAILLDQNLGFNNSTQGVYFINASGANRTFSVNLVPSGGRVASTNLAFPSTTNSSLRNNVTVVSCLDAGDSINLNVDTATSTYAWVNVMEIAQ